MKMSRCAPFLLLLSAGCAAPGYHSTYRVSGVPRELGAPSAEAARLAGVNAKAIVGDVSFDQPVQRLRAPLPVMSRDDTDAKITGRVVVDIRFSEVGLVEGTSIVESTKTSLSDSVIAAVSRWAMVPVTRRGAPAKLVARQAFEFRTEP